MYICIYNMHIYIGVHCEAFLHVGFHFFIVSMQKLSLHDIRCIHVYVSSMDLSVF